MDFLRWWGRELGGLVPLSIANFLNSNLVNYRLHRSLSDWHVMRRIGPFGSEREIDTGAWADMRERTLRRIARLGPLASVWITIAGESCLKRSIAVPGKALGQAEAIALLDLEHETPFHAGNALIGHTMERQPDRSWHVEQLVAKAGLVEAAVQDLAQRGVPVRGFAAIDRSNSLALTTSLPIRHSRLEAILVSLIAATIVALVAASLSLNYLKITAQTKQIEANAARLESLRQNVQKMVLAEQAETQRVARERRAIERRLAAVMPLSMLSELTRRLPDTAWVQNFDMNGRRLHLTGLAASPEGLIERLSASPLFQNVRFTSALTTARGVNRERFQIVLEIAQQSTSPSSVSQAKQPGGTVRQ